MSTEDEKLLKEAKKLPWEDRLMHKNWKVRNNANFDLAALCDSISDPKDPRLREFGELGFRSVDLVSSAFLPFCDFCFVDMRAFPTMQAGGSGRFPEESRLLWLCLAKLGWRLDNLAVQAPNSKYLQSGRGLWITTPLDMSYTCISIATGNKSCSKERLGFWVLLLCSSNLETMGAFTMVAIMMQLSGMSSLYAVLIGGNMESRNLDVKDGGLVTVLPNVEECFRVLL
ncbi:hypothetical protein RHGRI_023608 [Rhododendron griersonianum]|uniref:XMAP215/Dis1/CLASP TOG domain-containing protein n=1 Tax=Rhododendron griersonianum TaxID=479676 RepID=A0AAV6J494_9ERIC|nr:hypothetical protein RHGRI_023608 [Rhododendron griersonianum]